jgi:regulator of sigma E protease
VLRNGATLPPVVATPAKLDAGWKLGLCSRRHSPSREPAALNKAVAKSTAFCKDNSFLIVEVLQRLFTHKVSVSQLQGPVGIARMAGDAAEMKDWFPKFGLAADQPQPGHPQPAAVSHSRRRHDLLLLIESVMRRDISINVKERIYQAAFVVMVAFFAFVIFNDVTKLPIFTHLKP